MQLVFVCSGNTCRSPLALCAWHLAVQNLGENLGAGDGEPGEISRGAVRTLERIEASSAGLCATPGASAARYSQRIAQSWGGDLSAHGAQLFRPAHAQSDLILTMTADQSAVVRAHFEIGQSQVRRLGSYAPRRQRRAEAARFAPLWGDASLFSPVMETGSEFDILDPLGGSLEAYEACAAQIRRCVFELARSLAGFNCQT